ncbi:DNA translocase FtsK 4TM domain-containing protein [Porticoccaceae bacterium]|nr:DNA translocase FtsK 4TM domain-containing protein [Porticoccaceae bacterium]MDA7696527.1 DNA translocase FtsK 4TM domain-containing protein [Porticoccaceae bacterium]MDA8598146.1 DNA translocase FtsK 4TM domain-containing protein [Porticoccaceae bacterium]MDA8941432.1 DNA translocase FtsK 4TM domain-containing protein [Porticoccaceae bacterium]MDB2395679.1 DNA translocase FtsK 4TM domain-containing protein [Porticoccaceae bacterium]
MSTDKSKQTKKKLSGHPESSSRSKLLLAEGALIGWVALCLILLLALLSYSPEDPGWSHTGSREGVANLIGPAGAWMSDISFALFGLMAYLLPVLLGVRALQILRTYFLREPSEFDSATVVLRVVGFMLVMISATSLANIQYEDIANTYPEGMGGILGEYVGVAIISMFSHTGSTLLLLALFLFGLTVFADISWIKLIDYLGMSTIVIGGKARNYYSQRSIQRKEAKKAKAAVSERLVKVESAAKRKETKVPPVIQPVTQSKRPSPRVLREKQQKLFDDSELVGSLPQINLLDPPDKSGATGYSADSLEHLSRLLELKLQDFGITAEVTEVLPGPVVTRFEIQPAPGIKVSRISGLAKDLARSMAVISVRVVEVIPGKSVVGIEIPNEKREMVRLSEVISSEAFDRSSSPLTLALGNDIAGIPTVADLARMPHLLVAGTTGSGKSVGINAMLLSLLLKASPDEVKLILIDPKMLELSIYDDIPHLLTPVITDMKDAASGLRWCVGEMERRYKLMAALGVRNIAGYNRKIEDAIKAGNPIVDPLWTFDPSTVGWDETEEPPEASMLEALPYIVVVIDEFADMMMIVGKKVEQLIARIAQKARAAGIHLILATQRPSVDVITGLIKANVPTRIAFQVSSKIDSRTILDQGGAEQLLGHGDMLYLPPGTSVPERIHGAFVDDHEVHKVVADWKRRGTPSYLTDITDEASVSSIAVPGFDTTDENGDDAESDPLYDEAVAFVLESGKASISSVQRKLRVGYNRAARLIEQMEASGVVSPMSSNGSREILAPNNN